MSPISNLIHLPPRTSSSEYILGEDVSFGWLQDGQIASFTLTDMTREAVDIYFEANLMLAKTFTVEEARLLLLDLSKSGAPSPYFKAKLNDFLHEIRTIATASRYVAVLIPPGWFASIFIGINRVIKRDWASMADFGIFQRREKALAWLLGHAKN